MSKRSGRNKGFILFLILCRYGGGFNKKVVHGRGSTVSVKGTFSSIFRTAIRTEKNSREKIGISQDLRKLFLFRQLWSKGQTRSENVLSCFDGNFSLDNHFSRFVVGVEDGGSNFYVKDRC